MFPIFNFHHVDRSEVQAGVQAALEEHERDERNKRADALAAAEKARQENIIRNTPRKPITYDEIEGVIAMVINDTLMFSPGNIALEKAGRIVNALEAMLHTMAKVERLQKIVDSPQFSQDGELISFCGLPPDEAADAVLCCEEAIKYIPHTCHTCRFKNGIGGEMGYLAGCDGKCGRNRYCGNTEDGTCHWQWNKKFVPCNNTEEEFR